MTTLFIKLFGLLFFFGPPFLASYIWHRLAETYGTLWYEEHWALLPAIFCGLTIMLVLMILGIGLIISEDYDDEDDRMHPLNESKGRI